MYVMGMKKERGYWTVTVVVDGALELDEDCEMFERVDMIVTSTAEAALADGLPTELYILHHDHADDGEECACVQYLTDHHPNFTWNMES